MNVKDSNEVAVAICDIYNTMTCLPEKVRYSIDIDPSYDWVRVYITDCRNEEFKSHFFKYHQQMSVGTNAIGLKEWLATIL